MNSTSSFIVTALSLILFISGCVGVPDQDDLLVKPDFAPSAANPGEIKTSSDNLAFLLYKPKDYDYSKNEFPLLLFLHSADQRGNDIEKLRKVGPPLQYESGKKELPFILVAPHLNKNQAWNPRKLTSLIDEIEKDYRVDRRRIYVTGMSMGGYGTWILAGKTPERFAAISPIASNAYVEQSMDVRKVPSLVFHGRHDAFIPVNEAIDMVKAIQALGGSSHLKIYEDSDHDAWTKTYAADGFYTWLLSNELPENQNQQQPPTN
ncbi:prolyl oligopeptidase family serine peptidase [Planctomycetota bacterium]|nr:prolyl oligopeptidase family serine peptidase [Planctomycetota bacterium]